MTDLQAYEIPILRILQGGPVETSALSMQLFTEIGAKLLPGDFRVTSRGRLVRETNCSRALASLKQRGEAKNEARGVWEITTSGQDRLDREGDTWALEPYRNSHAKVRPLRERSAPDPKHDSAATTEPRLLPIESWWPPVRLHTGQDLFDDLTAATPT